ncbi:MAG: hypothetical protein RJA61_486 [Candidatus Parcubacteria bacterium]|jgi:UDP-glucose 6-dehydrogenase
MAAVKKPLIGFIGQGFVGKSYADDFEERGFSIVRYSLEPEYVGNKDKIKTCDIVFIAVPTPTTPKGFDYSIVKKAITLTGLRKIVVIKSTLLPGTTDQLQKIFPDRIILFSPEFLNASSAHKDVKKPIMNIVGIPENQSKYMSYAKKVLSFFAKGMSEHIVTAKEAEIFKYTHNTHGYLRVIFSNLIHDVALAFGARYEEIKKIMDIDPYMTHTASYYNNPLHKTGRGAGGACFIKDFAAFTEMYKKAVGDKHGVKLLESFEKKNLHLLISTKKDLDIVYQVYGKHVHKKLK